MPETGTVRKGLLAVATTALSWYSKGVTQGITGEFVLSEPIVITSSFCTSGRYNELGDLDGRDSSFPVSVCDAPARTLVTENREIST